MALRVSLWPALLLLPVMVATAAEAAVTEAAVTDAAVATTEALPAAEFVAPAAGKSPDPWEKFNRGVYRFNDVADRYVLRPVAKGYRDATPQAVRTGVTNFFSNLRSPLVVMNDLLQGKVKQAGGDTLRFVVNSTVGVLGTIDVASRVNLPVHDEDFGQTLGVWGLPSGPYLVLPFMGPSSVRDATGFGVDAVANPRRRLMNDEADWLLFGVDVVNGRASLLDLEDIIQGDRYLFIRDLYLQRREYSVQDGQIQDDPFLDDAYEDEDSGAEPAEDGAPASAPEAAPASPDATTPDATTPDATTPDATTPDATTPDADQGAADSALDAGLHTGLDVRPTPLPTAAGTDESALRAVQDVSSS